ncbi:MAG: nucleotidyltransferase domain-containing protein [Phycisphaerae bacterium]|nr:nucleotidyltransferase domain-containing protein [Phycisphaerae bacterium]
MDHFRPHRIILFGSYACGHPNDDSDVDLLITQRRLTASPLTAAGQIRLELGVRFAMDLIVRSEADVASRLSEGDAFLREIMQKGIELYAADDEGVGRKGRIRLRRRLRSAALPQKVPLR